MKKLNIIIAALLSLGFASCGDFLEEYSQDTAYVRSLDDLDELLLGSAYMPIHSYSSYANSGWNTDQAWFYPYINVMTDEVQENKTYQSTSGDLWGHPQTFYGYFTWQQLPGMNPEGTQLSKEDNDWQRMYKCINVANMVLAKISDIDVPGGKQLQAQRIEGEAHFIRAAFYYALVNLYGKPYSPATAKTDLGVALKTTEFVEDNIYNRNTVAECYDQIIADLDAAEKLLKNTPRVSNYRADINAVYLLRSRIALYMQNYADAASYAQKVIDAKPVLKDLNTIDTANKEYFLSNDLSEVIFTMGNGGLSWTINANITAYGISDDLYNAYEDNDLRKTLYVNRNSNGAYEYVKSGANGDISRSSLSANFLLRTSEAYLNLAEAEALQGNGTKAQQAVNKLREKRYVLGADSKITSTGTELINDIRNERMRELCLEGQRWFDLRRYMVNDKAPYTKTITHTYSIFDYGYSYVTWQYEYTLKSTSTYVLEPNDKGYTLPIPHEVLEFNLGMKNNDNEPRAAK